MQTELIPNPHAGETLREDFMKPLRLNQSELAKHLGVSETVLADLVRGKRSLTPALALRLSRYFGNSAEFWLGLQRDYDLMEARRRLADRIAQQVQPRELVTA